MNPYNQPDSDINEEERTIWVKCPECQQSYPLVLCQESLIELYVQNEDGTYTDIYESVCVSCLEQTI